MASSSLVVTLMLLIALSHSAAMARPRSRPPSSWPALASSLAERSPFASRSAWLSEPASATAVTPSLPQPATMARMQHMTASTAAAEGA